MPATIREVAARAGVSVTTVSNYLGGRLDRMRPETRRRIEEAIAELGFQVNLSARQLASGESKLIGIVFQASNRMLSSYSYFSQLIEAVQSTIAPAGYQLLVTSCHGVNESQEASLRSYCRRRVEGVILTNRSADDHSYRLLTRAGIPFVNMFHVPDQSDEYVVAVNYEHDGHMMADHLLDLGHKRLALLSGYQQYYHHRLRVQGFLRCLEERGVAIDPAWVIETDGQPEAAEEATRQLLSQAQPPTAIYSTNDFMAMGVIAEAHRLGRRVPQDLSVAGCDGSDFGEHLSPSLTSVKTSILERARLSAEMLLRLIAGEKPEPGIVLFLGELVVRDSTGPVPEAKREDEPAHLPAPGAVAL